MNESKRILIQSADVKSKLWSEAANRMGIGSLDSVKGSPMKLLPKYLISLLKANRYDAICFRYLNDYPSFLRTTVRALVELVTILVARSFGTKIIWICHNVDKDSETYYPLINRLRRKWLVYFAKNVFVTDKLLIKHARRFLSIDEKKIKSTCFGEICCSGFSSETEACISQISNWVAEKRVKMDEIKIGLWIGSSKDKVIEGLNDISMLMCGLFEREGEQDNIAIVIVGEGWKLFKRYNYDLAVVMESLGSVFIVDEQLNLPTSLWSKYFDFVVKSLDDYSVSFTHYNAISNRLPIVTFNKGFGSEFVHGYNVGVLLDSYDIQSEELKFRIANGSFNFESFLRLNSWDSGASSLFDFR
jgi:hypothetical protein